MPLFGLHKHNRSKQALNDNPHQADPQESTQQQAPSASTSTPARYVQSEPTSPHHSSATYFEAPAEQSIQAPETSPPYSSKRYSSVYLSHANSSLDDLDRDLQEHQAATRYSAQIASPLSDVNANIKHKKGRGLLDRLKGGARHQADQQRPAAASFHEQHQQQQQQAPRSSSRLVRRLSKRSENLPPPTIRTAAQRDLHDQYDWQGSQSEPSHLESPSEAQEDDNDHAIDPYLIRDPETQQIRVNPYAPAEDDSSQSTEEPDQTSDTEEEPEIVEGDQYAIAVEQPLTREPQGPLAPHPPASLGVVAGLNPRASQRANTETSSQYSRRSPEEEEEIHRPASEQSTATGISPSDTLSSRRDDFPSRTSSIQPPKGIPQVVNMAPATSQQTRRNDLKQSPSGTSGNASTPSLQIGSTTSNPPPNYSRGGSGSGHQYVGSEGRASEQGRSTPPPAPSERDIGEAYKELSQKYKKVKGLYFDKTAQVEQLQNTLANQRMSQSRTSLDDNEYMTRFNRLDGAITNLAFNIRKDWKAIPSWIAQCVNADASRIGRQEMTAVGRACISRFLIDEIFSRCFHPGLDPELSANLKAVEINIRRFSPMTNSQEESDALTTKVVQWRLSTLDGLRDALNSLEAEECKKQFTLRSTSNLTAHLINCLVEPTPPGVEDSAHMIIELAVSIAANLPLESRDLSIIYPMPGDILQPFIMKVETGLPPLDNHGLLGDTSSDHDGSSINSGDREDSPEKDGKRGVKDKPKGTGMLAAMMNQGTNGASKKGGLPSPGLEADKKGVSDTGSGIVRFAGFVGVEVRGRQVLVKSPVWTVT